MRSSLTESEDFSLDSECDFGDVLDFSVIMTPFICFNV